MLRVSYAEHIRVHKHFHNRMNGVLEAVLDQEPGAGKGLKAHSCCTAVPITLISQFIKMLGALQKELCTKNHIIKPSGAHLD